MPDTRIFSLWVAPLPSRVGSMTLLTIGIHGNVPPQKPPVAQYDVAVATDWPSPSPDVTAHHPDVEIRPAVGQGVQLLDHLWEVVGQGFLLWVHRRRVVDQEQDVDPAIRRNQDLANTLPARP
jgi:hypothetical protein